jgi:hypothetical protein
MATVPTPHYNLSRYNKQQLEHICVARLLAATVNSVAWRVLADNQARP